MGVPEVHPLATKVELLTAAIVRGRAFPDSFKAGNRLTRLQIALSHLEYAVNDADAARVRYVELAQSYDEAQRTELQRALARLHYHSGLVYTVSRRLLDAVVRVADGVLPKREVTLKRSHSRFAERLQARCREAGLDPPGELLDEIRALNQYIVFVRDKYIDHLGYTDWWPITSAPDPDGNVSITLSDPLFMGTQSDPPLMGTRSVKLDDPREIRQRLHSYVNDVVDFLLDTVKVSAESDSSAA